MKKVYYILSLSILMILVSCKDENTTANSTVKVHFSGALKNIMGGDINAVISLDSLSKYEHLYALGAAENLKGEIQIFDDLPFISSVKDSSIYINTSYKQKASLLVYTTVDNWQTFEINDIKDSEALETKLYELAIRSDIDINHPFPFIVEGKTTSLDWHIIDWKEGDSIHTHQKHKESGLKGQLKEKSVQVLGFYSKNHKGIFTHHSSNLHMHFRTKDGKITGHVDQLKSNQPITIKLPKQ